MFSKLAFMEKYDVETREMAIGGRTFKYFLPRSLEPFIDEVDPMKGFPLWAKVWPSSMVLADFIAAEPVREGEKILEIGAGLGTAGIAAASFGHDIVISECNPHALRFARANAHLNGLAATPVIAMDWDNPGISGRFDKIIGSEVVFRNEDFSSLRALFESLLKPDGEAILVSEIRKTAIEFFQKMSGLYEMKAKQMTLRSAGQEIKIMFCRMTPRKK